MVWVSCSTQGHKPFAIGLPFGESSRGIVQCGYQVAVSARGHPSTVFAYWCPEVYSESKEQFPALLDKLAPQGIVMTKPGRPVAKIVPYLDNQGLSEGDSHDPV